MTADKDGTAIAYPDTVFGTDSHTTMINGIGVLGWGVGGIEAEAAMLGQPSSMLIPQVVGFKLTGKLPEGATATDLVLTVTQMLRKLGVVGKFVEFYGDGLQHLPLADRATIGNMAPEYGATCGIFPIDAESLNYLRLSGRSEEQINLVEAYAKAQGLWHEPGSPHAQYSTTLELDMGTVKPSLAGPKRPQDRVLLEDVQKNYREALVGMTANRDKRSEDVSSFVNEGGGAAVGNEQMAKGFADIEIEHHKVRLKDGAVVIAAITSCTNPSTPAVMIGAGLLARNPDRARDTLVLAPRFPGSIDSGFGGMAAWRKASWEDGEESIQAAGRPAPVTSFQVLDDLLRSLDDRKRLPTLANIVLAGHSAGAQLVQRYAVLNNTDGPLRRDGLALRYVIANPSSYLYLTNERPRADGKGYAPCHRTRAKPTTHGCSSVMPPAT
ncbi:hypothetical protein G6F68_010176 [Rhizopus microsporus]|nr:hypothetical protein G6F68_010176 [Rhizopus microsporus]